MTGYPLPIGVFLVGDSQVDDTLASHLAWVKLAHYAEKTQEHQRYRKKYIRLTKTQLCGKKYNPLVLKYFSFANVFLNAWHHAKDLAKVSPSLQKHCHFPRTVNVNWFIQLAQSWLEDDTQRPVTQHVRHIRQTQKKTTNPRNPHSNRMICVLASLLFGRNEFLIYTKMTTENVIDAL